MQLLTYITGHGYGHAAQTVAVLDALTAARPSVSLTICTTVPERWCRDRLHAGFTYIYRETDTPLRMDRRLGIDVAASAAAYLAFHADWQQRVAAERRFLDEQQPDQVLSNIAYLPLAAAATQSLPSLAFCSINWADAIDSFVARADPALRDTLQGIAGVARRAYQSADTYIKPEPAMPMPWLENARQVAPVVGAGKQCAAQIKSTLGITGKRMVVVSLGGHAADVPISPWPRIPGVCWLTSFSAEPQREDMFHTEALDTPFPDLMASADAVIGKLGYGMVTECVTQGVPMLYLERPDWPEEPVLAVWLASKGRGAAISHADLPQLAQHLDALWAQPGKPAPAADGAAQAAAIIGESLP